MFIFMVWGVLGQNYLCAQTNAERVDYLLEQLQQPLDLESQEEIKGAVMRIWELSKSAEIQEKINKIGIFINLRNYQGAEDFLTEIINAQGDFIDAYYKRAIVHYYQGDVTQAEGDLLKVLAFEPRHFDALKVLGLVLEKQEKNQKAFEVYLQLKKVLPYDPSVDEKILEIQKIL